jgi:hypothetical protein
VLVSTWGPLPHALPVQRTIARAELYAVRQALRHCLPPIRVHVDCMLILRGVANGRRWCTHSSRPHADIWREIWHLIDDIGLGPDGASFHKVAAHVSQARLDACSVEEKRLLQMNMEADGKAKLGATMGVNHFLQFVEEAVEQRANEVKGALDFIAKFADAVYARDGGWRDVVAAPRGLGDVPKPHKIAPVVRRRDHVIVATVFGYRCVQCRRVALSAQGLTSLVASKCMVHAPAALVLDSLASTR